MAYKSRAAAAIPWLARQMYSEGPEQAAAAIGTARGDIRVGVVAEPKMMASVEVVWVAAATEMCAGIAVAAVALVTVVNFQNAFASVNALGVTRAESECVGGEEGCSGDADCGDKKFFHDFVPVAAVNRSLIY